MTDEKGFLIDGAIYPVPAFGTFTMGEAQVFYDYAGFPFEQLAAVPADVEDRDAIVAEIERKLDYPGVHVALAHIAYARGNPRASKDKVERIVRATNRLTMMSGLFSGDDAETETAEEDARPPDRPPVERSPSMTDGSKPSSGGRSANGTTEPDTDPVTTGRLRSDTSPTSPHLERAT